MRTHFYIFLLVFIGIGQSATAQIDTTHDESLSYRDTMAKKKYVSLFNADDPLLEDDEEPPKEFKEKRKKRKVYYDIKTKKGFTKQIKGQNQIVEIFHFCKRWNDPSPYANYVYWYDPVKRKIARTKQKKMDPLTSKILHGPYKKMVNGIVVEKGIYHLGTKHGRWEKWGPNKEHKFLKDSLETVLEYQVLVSKERYDQGWPRESERTYYDQEKTKLKEVMPMRSGKVTGEYYFYFENAKLGTIGHYQNGVKIGKWLEYHPGERHRKKILIKYPENAISKEEPQTLKEWDTDGHLIYDIDGAHLKNKKKKGKGKGKH